MRHQILLHDSRGGTSILDARSLLEGLQGEDIYTLTRGDRNRVLAVHATYYSGKLNIR